MLLQQIEQLEKSQTTYEEQITQLRQHKEECEKLLKSHQSDCNKTFSSPSPTPATSVKSEPLEGSADGHPSPASPPNSINTPSPQHSSEHSTCHSSPSGGGHTTTASFTATDDGGVMIPPASPLLSAPSSSSLSRRKQATPRGLNLDISCADSHRRSSSSSSGDMQSPKVIL